MIYDKADINEESLNFEMQQIAERLDLNDYREALLFPKYFQIETVRVCNAACPFCGIDQWNKSVPTMRDDLFDKIVAELAQYREWINSVCVSRAGEPLLDRKIADRVFKLKQAGIKKVNLTTNASLLS